jgi:hypothetical protein
MRQGVAYNKEKTNSVVLAKMKEFSIIESYQSSKPQWVVRGWFNKENNFCFGYFDTEEEARAFLDQIHAMY